MSIGDILVVSLLGILVVFSVLVILMITIMIMTKVFEAAKKNKKAETVTPVEIENDKSADVLAAGTAGSISLYDVPDKIAAMAMAIVADELKTPLNELRFISIKELEDEKK